MSLLKVQRIIRLQGQRLPPARSFSASTSQPSAWTPSPSPPRLPKDEQEIFEKLQQQSTGAFTTPRDEKSIEEVSVAPSRTSTGDGGELHPSIRKGAAPEFEGDTNPKTGEVNGPKNEPLRWPGDWSYNGRATDF